MKYCYAARDRDETQENKYMSLWANEFSALPCMPICPIDDWCPFDNWDKRNMLGIYLFFWWQNRWWWCCLLTTASQQNRLWWYRNWSTVFGRRWFDGSVRRIRLFLSSWTVKVNILWLEEWNYCSEMYCWNAQTAIAFTSGWEYKRWRSLARML